MAWPGTVIGRLKGSIKRRYPSAPAPNPSQPVAAVNLAGESNQARLARLADWCLGGRIAAAELELHDWRRHEDCPAQARVMLAALLARRGATEQALAVVAPASRSGAQSDSEQALMHLALLLTAELPDTARRAALNLYHHHGQSTSVRAWLAAMQPPGLTELPAVPRATIDQLAGDLRARPAVIPALVAAQKLRPDLQQVSLLRQALDRAARDLSDNPQTAVPTCQALAELALLADDRDDARRWAHRGLRLDPYAVALALILAQVSDDPAVGPPAHQVLAQAADMFPNYPDLQAAAIRREHSDGNAAAARMRLEHWLARSPQHPAAKRLAEELAA
jgi:hypothetical protein